jgi:hypothetical protein
MNRKVVTLVNRTDKDFHFMYDGIQYKVPAQEELDATEDVANHARKKSIMSYDLESGRALYQIGIKGVHDIGFMGAGKTNEDELINRETDIQGKAVKINVRGGRVAPSRDADALSASLEE